MARSSLTIYIDARCLLRPRDGVGSYAARLLENILDTDTANTYIALGFADQKNSARLVAGRTNFHYHFLPMTRRAYMGLYRIWQLPVDRFLPSKPDVVWYPDFVAAPWIRGGKKILTIHDLTFIDSPEVVERKNLRYLRRFVPQSITQVDEITAVSHAMAKRIQDEFAPNIPTTVIYPIAPPQTPGLPANDPYILFVGTMQPRKNIGGLLRAYMLLPENLRKTFRLVLAGRRGWKDKATLDLMERTPHSWIDSPTDKQLHNLFLHASLFVLPSIQEGFGIPAIEALACHIPVVTSQDPALVEATNGAALHVPADSPQKLAIAMEQILTDVGLRQKLATHRDESLAKLDGAKNARAFLQRYH